MRIKNFLVSFLVIFCITFIVSVVVTYLYRLIADGTGAIDWLVSFRQGIIFGIILPLVNIIQRDRK